METDPVDNTCQRCKSVRLFRFNPVKETPTEIRSLPVVCRDCGQITVDGKAVSFPVDFETHARALAEVASEAGAQAVKNLEKDPNQPIAGYFERIYRTAYLDGFWRAVLFWRHNAKEGRLKRLRELWKQIHVSEQRSRQTVTIDDPEEGRIEHEVFSNTQTVLWAPPEVYAEFKQLLELGAGDQDAASPPNESPPVSDRHA